MGIVSREPHWLDIKTGEMKANRTEVTEVPDDDLDPVRLADSMLFLFGSCFGENAK